MKYADKMEFSNIQLYEVSDTHIENLVLKAIRCGADTVVVGPSAVPVVNRMVKPEDGIKVNCALSYPSGCYLPFQKVQEIEGIFETDMKIDAFYIVMAVGSYLSGHVEEMKAELKTLTAAAGNMPVKIVTEIGPFSNDQMKEFCDAAADANVQGVVISADFKPYDVPAPTLEQVKAFVDAAAGRFEVIGAGEVTTAERFLGMLDAGVNKVNTTAGYEILIELNK